MRESSPDAILKSYRLARDITGRSGSSFRLGFKLLPRDQADAMHALYAFCRITDDIADGPGSTAEKKAELDRWQASLANPTDAGVFPALNDAIRRFGINPRDLNDQIQGARWDLEQRAILTRADLEQYCDLVAGSVGSACLAIWGCKVAEAREPSRAAGHALQFTNILRDLAEDRDRGRIYLPAEDLEKFDCPPERWQPEDSAFQKLMSFQIESTIEKFRTAERLVPLIPRPGRRVYRLFLDRYRAILEEIVRRKFDVFSTRVRVGRWTTARILLKAMLS